jgi:hypothetical protein
MLENLASGDYVELSPPVLQFGSVPKSARKFGRSVVDDFRVDVGTLHLKAFIVEYTENQCRPSPENENPPPWLTGAVQESHQKVIAFAPSLNAAP